MIFKNYANLPIHGIIGQKKYNLHKSVYIIEYINVT